MTNRDVVALAARILAMVTIVMYLYIIIASLAALLLGAWEVVFEPQRVFPDLTHYALGVGFLVVPGVAYLLAAWFLWTRAEWIAQKVIPDAMKSDAWPRLRSEDLQVVAFTVIGMLTLLTAVRYLAASLSFAFRTTYSVHEWAVLPETLSAAVGLIFGTGLLLGSRGVARTIYFLRIAGRRPSPGDDTYEVTEEAG